MSAARAILAIVAAAACAPERVVLDLDARTLIVVEVTSGTPMNARATSASEVSELSNDRGLWILAYDLAAEELGAFAGGAPLEVLPAGPSDDAAWTLPPPKRAWTVEAGGLPVEGGAVELDAFRIARPPCRAATLGRSIAVDTVPRSAKSVVRRDAELLVTLGYAFDADERPIRDSEVRRYTPGEGSFVADAPRGEVTTSPILAFEDEGRWLLWPRSDGDLELFSADDARRPSVRFARPSELPARYGLQKIASARVRGRWTVLVRALATATDGRRMSHFLALYPDAGEARTIFDPLETFCGLIETTTILALRADGTGIVAGEGHAPATFDLEGGAPTPIPGAPEMCRSAYAVSSSGTEVMSYTDANGMPSLGWRAPGSAWRFIAATIAAGRDLVAFGDRFATSSGQVVELLEHAPHRPELPPRACQTLPAGVDSPLLILGAEDELFVVGNAAHAATIAL